MFVPNPWFFRWCILTLSVGAILIWWGAAVTTEDVGLSVPDWPLAFGRINPEGWMKVPALLLEHGHRWLGATVGMLVLTSYLWVFRKEKPGFIELAGVILCGVGYLYLVYAGALELAGIVAVLGLLWLVLTWRVERWSILRGLTTLALLLVIIQASLGGLRVLKMSDPYGIMHGTLGQLFYCVLVLTTLLSSRAWRHGVPIQRGRLALTARLSATVLVLAVFMQLIFGAILRHTQRLHLAASDILTTDGKWLPDFTHPDLAMLFLHKYWGFSVAILVLLVAHHARRWIEVGSPLRWVPNALSVLPIVQVGLGISVIWTGKSFWVTNFHVLNGLALLALSCLLAAAAWGGSRSLGDVAHEDRDARKESVQAMGVV